MDLDGSKQVCGICQNWRGQREYHNGIVHVKPSAKGQCVQLNKKKPPHGGCDQWQKWHGKDEPQ